MFPAFEWLLLFKIVFVDSESFAGKSWSGKSFAGKSYAGRSGARTSWSGKSFASEAVSHWPVSDLHVRHLVPDSKQTNKKHNKQKTKQQKTKQQTKNKTTFVDQLLNRCWNDFWWNFDPRRQEKTSKNVGGLLIFTLSCVFFRLPCEIFGSSFLSSMIWTSCTKHGVSVAW